MSKIAEQEFVIEATKDIGFLLEGHFYYISSSKRKAKKLFKKTKKNWLIKKVK